MIVPIALFVYNRPDTLSRTLNALRADNVPLLYIFSDAPKRPVHAEGVQQVRDLIHRIEWTETHIIERETNYGLGRSILSGVSHVLEQHEAIIVFEDDLICAPGTYRYFSDALQHYRDESRVMSITAWNNTELIPPDVSAPYFDGRAESLTWGTWGRAWDGITDTDAMTLLRDYRRSDRDIRRYGEDIPAMALMEAERNLWLVRWILLHLVNDGLCMRPPHTMVEHIGYSAGASNAPDSEWIRDDPPQPLTAMPDDFPAPAEHPDTARLWRLHRYNYWRRLPVTVRLRAGVGLIRRMVRERFFFWPFNEVK